MDTKPTNKSLQHLLPKVLNAIADAHQKRPDLVIAYWSDVIGEKLASMTEATAFVDGILHVKVKNAALYSILIQQEGKVLTKKLQEKFPKIAIRCIRFRMG